MRQNGSAPEAGEGQAQAEIALGLQALSHTLDRSTVGMSLLSLDTLLQAANSNSPLAAADGAQELAGQLERQMRELEAAIAEVMRAELS